MLWFKNLLIYQLNRDIELNAALLEEQLSHYAFTPCGSLDTSKTGWVSPLGPKGETFTHAVGGQIIITARKEDKILPSTVIKQALQEKIDQLEAQQGRKLKKTEKDTLKDEVTHSLLPRAFSKFSQTSIWIDTTKGLIMVDAGSSKRAEETLALLRKSIGSLPVVPLTPESPIELTLTQWVKSQKLPAGFEIEGEAELKGILEGSGIIRCKDQDLFSDEIAVHREANKLVTKLSLFWRERIHFLLSDDGSLKRIKFADTLKEQNEDIDKADIAQRFDADFVLMTGELAELISELIVALNDELPAE